MVSAPRGPSRAYPASLSGSGLAGAAPGTMRRVMRLNVSDSRTLAASAREGP